ncbi:phosphoadenylyl-sulfate reductase [Limibaculum sp. FT325]|uniref:phosphoadenylyl-sulfate reductase n=1 Tax=Thermohalobaculum sediminis TaxID=2939436 RepID=UPI0020BFC8F8|nr:phosphoadenylyl-sulfate reductase [Limibaculum sediminis]MCL5777654.1 phosphoadenylyl-sulfate reductase [Limibaculum sediminis]
MADGLSRPIRRMSAAASAAALNRIHGESSAEEVLAEALAVHDRGEVALVSSFGAESVVLLHMLSHIERDLPVLFLETGMLFPETLAYQRDLAARFGLRDVRLIRPDPRDLTVADPDGRLHRRDTDGCCDIRKTLPLQRALQPFAAWITGRKRYQSQTRAALEPFEVEAGTVRMKINPLALWDAKDAAAYIDRHGLPRHPLVARGYPSIGCAPCTSPVGEGEDPRAGRWRGQAKVECGIHFDGESWIRSAASLPGPF